MNDLIKNINLENNICITGLTFELNIFYVLEKFRLSTENVLVVTNSLYEANQIYNNLLTYTSDVLLFPMDDFLTSVALAISPDLKMKRLETIQSLNSNSKKIVITNLMGYLKYLPKKEEANNYINKIIVNDKIKREDIIETLEKLGYKRESLVTSTGEYAVRGYIIDVFIIDAEHPYRIEMFGDEIDNIRIFNENTQISITKINEISLYPFSELETEDKVSLYEYMNNPLVIYYNFDQIKAGYKKLTQEIFDYNISMNQDSNKKYMFNMDQITVKNSNYIGDFNSSCNLPNFSYKSNELENFNSNFELLKTYVLKEISKKQIVIFCLSRKEQIKKINELLNNVKSINKIENLIQD